MRPDNAVACTLATPVGNLLLGERNGALTFAIWECAFIAHPERYSRVIGSLSREGSSPLLDVAIDRLVGFFEGRRVSFDLPLELHGTPFQCSVWNVLRDIDRSRTYTYGEIAAKIGCAKAVRAVATAIASNPLSIFVPCHLIVPACGSGVGNYAGGAKAKRELIQLEHSLIIS